MHAYPLVELEYDSETLWEELLNERQAISVVPPSDSPLDVSFKVALAPVPVRFVDKTDNAGIG